SLIYSSYLYIFHLLSSLLPSPPGYTLFPYTTLFRSIIIVLFLVLLAQINSYRINILKYFICLIDRFTCSFTLFRPDINDRMPMRSEEHTSELQSRENLVCRLLLEKKKLNITHSSIDS